MSPVEELQVLGDLLLTATPVQGGEYVAPYREVCPRAVEIGAIEILAVKAGVMQFRIDRDLMIHFISTYGIEQD